MRRGIQSVKIGPRCTLAMTHYKNLVVNLVTEWAVGTERAIIKVITALLLITVRL